MMAWLGVLERRRPRRWAIMLRVIVNGSSVCSLEIQVHPAKPHLSECGASLHLLIFTEDCRRYGRGTNRWLAADHTFVTISRIRISLFKVRITHHDLSPHPLAARHGG